MGAHNITSDAHNVTVDTFSQKSHTQKDNENMILKSDKLDKSDALEEMLKGLTINDAEYYESDSANANDAKGNPSSDPKIATHTSDGKKRKVMDTSNRDLQRKLFSNRTLLIITTTMDPGMGDRAVTCRASPHNFVSPQTT